MTSEHDPEDDGSIVLNEVKVKFGRENFTHNGSNLRFKNHPLDRNVKDFIPLKELVRTKAGKVAARQPAAPPKKTHPYWKAQCRLRGINYEGTVDELQEALRGHEHEGLDGRLVQFEISAKQDYKVQNLQAQKELRIKRARVLEADWIGDKLTDLQKFNADSKRFLNESFSEGGEVQDAIVVEQIDHKDVQQAANDAGMHSGLVEPSPVLVRDGVSSRFALHNNRSPMWTVVGKNARAVSTKISAINKESKKRKREIEKHEQEAERKRAKQAHDILANCKAWDITGEWKINCPYIEDNWLENDEDLTLKIVCEERVDGHQMYARFDFGVISGVFRFEKQPANSQPKKKALATNISKQGSKSKQSVEDESEIEAESEDEDEDEDDDESHYYSRGRQSPTPEAFFLGAISHPSKKHNEWNYRWRGQESGEDEIALGSDNKLFTITFGGPRGYSLEGTFGGGCVADCTFTGEKVAPIGNSRISISQKWHSLNENAYEEARIGRWH